MKKQSRILATLLVVMGLTLAFAANAFAKSAGSTHFVVPRGCAVKHGANWARPGGDPVRYGGAYNRATLHAALVSSRGRRAMQCAGLSYAEQNALIRATATAKLGFIPQGSYYGVMSGGSETFTDGRLTGGTLAAWTVIGRLPNGATVTVQFAQICVNVVPRRRTAPKRIHKYHPQKRHPAALNYSCTGISVQHTGLVLLATVTTRQSRGVTFAYASWNWGDKSKIQKTGSKTASHTYQSTFAGSVAVAVYFNVGSSTRVVNCRRALIVSGPAGTPAQPTTCSVNGVTGQVVNSQCIITTTTTTQTCGDNMHQEGKDQNGNVICVANTNTNTNTNTQGNNGNCIGANACSSGGSSVSYSPVCSALMTSDKSNRVFSFDGSKSTASNGSTPTGASWTFTKNGATVGTASGLSTSFTFADYQTVYNWTAVISFAGGSATCSGSVTTGAAPPPPPAG